MKPQASKELLMCCVQALALPPATPRPLPSLDQCSRWVAPLRQKEGVNISSMAWRLSGTTCKCLSLFPCSIVQVTYSCFNFWWQRLSSSHNYIKKSTLIKRLCMSYQLLVWCRDSGLELLGEVSTQPIFKPWELSDLMPRIKIDLAMRDPSTQALELLHRAAFRNTGLGNSLFLEQHNMGKISTTLVGFSTFKYWTLKYIIISSFLQVTWLTFINFV